MKRRPPGPQSQTSKRRSERDGGGGWAGGGGRLEQPGQIRANAPRPANGAQAAVSWGCGCREGEGVLRRVLGPNREWGQGWGPRPSRRGPQASEPGSEGTPRPQRPWCCSRQTHTCRLGLKGAKGRTSPHPYPSFVPGSPAATEEPKRRHKDSWAENHPPVQPCLATDLGQAVFPETQFSHL